MKTLFSAIILFSLSTFAQEDTSNCFPDSLKKNQQKLEDAGFVQTGEFEYEVIKYRLNGFSYWKNALAFRYEKEGYVAYATCHTILKQALAKSQIIELMEKTTRQTFKVSVEISDLTLKSIMAEKVLSLNVSGGNRVLKFNLREEKDMVWTDRWADGFGNSKVTLRVQISREGKISAAEYRDSKYTWIYGSDMGESQFAATIDDNTEKSDLVVTPMPELKMCYGQSSLIEVRNRSSFIVDCEPTNGTSAQLKRKKDQYSFESAFPSLLKLTPYEGHSVWYEMKQIPCD